MNDTKNIKILPEDRVKLTQDQKIPIYTSMPVAPGGKQLPLSGVSKY